MSDPAEELSVAGSSDTLSSTEPFSPTEHLERLIAQETRARNVSLARWFEYILSRHKEARRDEDRLETAANESLQ